jgi:hypothetical protein
MPDPFESLPFSPREFALERTINHNAVECPWCGYLEPDSHQLEDDGRRQCARCLNPFTWSRCTTLFYSTEKLPS